MTFTEEEIKLLKYVLGEAICGVNRYVDDEYHSIASYYFTDDEMNTAQDLLAKLNGENFRDFVNKVIDLNMVP